MQRLGKRRFAAFGFAYHLAALALLSGPSAMGLGDSVALAQDPPPAAAATPTAGLAALKEALTKAKREYRNSIRNSSKADDALSDAEAQRDAAKGALAAAPDNTELLNKLTAAEQQVTQREVAANNAEDDVEQKEQALEAAKANLKAAELTATGPAKPDTAGQSSTGRLVSRTTTPTTWYFEVELAAIPKLPQANPFDTWKAKIYHEGKEPPLADADYTGPGASEPLVGNKIRFDIAPPARKPGTYLVKAIIAPGGATFAIAEPDSVTLGKAPNNALDAPKEPSTADKVTNAGSNPNISKLVLKDWIVNLARTSNPPLVAYFDVQPQSTTQQLSDIFDALAVKAAENAKLIAQLKGTTESEVNQRKTFQDQKLNELRTQMRNELDKLYLTPGVEDDWRPFLTRIQDKVNLHKDKINLEDMGQLAEIFAQVSDAFKEIKQLKQQELDKTRQTLQQSPNAASVRRSAASGAYDDNFDDGCRRRRRRRPCWLLLGI